MEARSGDEMDDFVSRGVLAPGSLEALGSPEAPPGLPSAGSRASVVASIIEALERCRATIPSDDATPKSAR
jgi:hypothetical protein